MRSQISWAAAASQAHRDGMDTPDLLDALRMVLGSDHVATDPATRALAGADLLPGPDAVPPIAVLRPADTAQTASVVRLLAASGTAMVARGAGLSYTGGVVPHVPGVVIDTARLDAVRVVPGDLYAVVGAGCTWQRLVEALRPHRLRPAPSAPISGSHSTIGGAMSQGIGGAAGFLAVSVVLADGDVVRTGGWAAPGGVPFTRDYGPDLTGLFIGDCGAFGIKTEIAVRLLPPADKRFASFGFDHGASVVAAMVHLQRGPGGHAIGFDRARAEVAAGSVTLGEVLRTAWTVTGKVGSIRQAIRNVAALGQGRGSLVEPPWSLHLTAEGPTGAAATARLDAMRRVCLQSGGRAIPPVVPMALDARPFSVRGLVGVDGERWVPVHGTLPLSAAGDCLSALQASLDRHHGDARSHGVRTSWLLQADGPHVTLEPMFYWRDALDPLHLRFLSERNRARFADVPPAPGARAFVAALRTELRDVMDSHGATHHQLGRFYAPPRGSVLSRLKAQLDPERRLNPGVLGL